jgi:RNA polymerase sigma factor (sigma-70 family)
MPARPYVDLADTIRSAVRRVTVPTDADLLVAFTRDRDPAAFEALARRYGPLVANVCRSVLPSPADADDAAQATFLVLFRRAATVRPATLPGWLFRVARRAALEVKRAADRRRVVEAKGASREVVPGPDVSWREAVAILHEELDRLPAKYREPLILCYLDGRVRDEAAVELGCSIDALRGRLDHGRAKLGARLRRRGVALSVGLLAAAAGPAPAPAEVVRHVLSPSAKVEAVARAVVAPARGWAMGSAIAMAAALFASGALVEISTADPPKQPEPPAKVSAPRPDAYGDPLPDGAVARLGTLRFNHGRVLRSLHYSPDGKAIVSVSSGLVRLWDAETGQEVRQFHVTAHLYEDTKVAAFDGKTVVVARLTSAGDELVGYDVSTGREVSRRMFPTDRLGGGRFRWRHDWIFCPDGRRAVANTPKKVHVFDPLTATELWTFARPSKEERAVAFAGPDRLVIADPGRPAELWNTASNELLRSFDLGEAAATIVGSPDGKWLATLDHDVDGGIDRFRDPDVVRVWDLETGTCRHRLRTRPNRHVLGLRFTPDGKSLAVGSVSRGQSETTIWDLATAEPRVLDGYCFVRSVVAFRPDGRRMVIGDESGKFEVVDLATGRPVVGADAGGQSVLHLSPSANRVLTLGQSEIRTWDGTTGRSLGATLIPADAGYPSLARGFSPDGRYVQTQKGQGQGVEVVIWDRTLARVALRVPLSGETYYTSADFTPDSSRVVVRQTGPKSTMSVWDLKTGRQTCSFTDPELPRSWVFAIAGETDVVVIPSRRIVGYSLSDGRELFSWRVAPAPRSTTGMQGGDGGESLGFNLRSFVVSPDGALAAYTLAGGHGVVAPDRLVVCELQTGRVVRRWGDRAVSGWSIGYLAFSLDGRLIASSADGVVRVWEVATGREVRHFRGHRGEIGALVFSADGRRLASAGDDSTTLLWDLTAPAADESQPAEWWADLRSDDPVKAWAAVWHFADAPDDVTVPYLRDRLQTATAADVEKVRQAVRDLDHDRFAVRERAAAELARLGHLAVPVLRAALDAKPTAEARQRIEALLEKSLGPPAAGEPLRLGRALAALERKGTPEAKRLLKDLAAGADGAWLTHEARAALARLSARGL